MTGRSKGSRRWFWPFFLAHLTGTLLLLWLPGLLLLQGETAGGRWVGAGIGSLCLLPMAIWLWFVRPRALSMISGVALFLVLAIVCFRQASIHAPIGQPEGGNFSSYYLGAASFNPSGLPTLVPEIDQLKLGTQIIPIDPFINGQQAKHIQTLFQDLYREMRADRSFVEAGSALGMCYEDLFLAERKQLHFFQYVPRQLEKPAYPVLLFLHGSLGNFKGYSWVLKELADEYGYAILAPTYGAGNWNLDPQAEVCAKMLAYIRENPELREESVFLAGLSNGGKGVSRAIPRHGEDLKGIIYISAVIEPRMVEDPDYVIKVGGLPVLLLHGELDRRIPASFIRESAAVTEANAASYESHYYVGEDHFLMFSQRAWLVEKMGAWMTANSEQVLE